MKILHVITSLRLGGAERLLTELLPRLQQMGHKVAVYSFLGINTPFADQLRRAGIEVIMGPENRSVYNPGHIRILRQLMPLYDIVHTHNSSSQLFAALANIGCDTPLVTTEHNTTNRKRNHWFLHQIDRWMYRQYRQIICISPAVKQQLNADIPCTINRSIVVYNGIDMSRFEQAQPADLREIIGADIPSQTFFVIMVAAFRWEKDHATLIKAMTYLPDNLHLLLVGTDHYGLQAKSQQLVESLHLTKRVHFLGERTDVPSLLKAADVVVQSTHVDGFCLAAVEGMASSKPVVVSDVPGIREVVQDYGLIFPHQNAKALSEHILQLYQNDNYSSLTASRCKQHALEFDINRMVSNYNTVYQNIIAQAQ